MSYNSLELHRHDKKLDLGEMIPIFHPLQSIFIYSHRTFGWYTICNIFLWTGDVIMAHAHTHQEIKLPKIPMKEKLSHGVSKIYRFDDNSEETVHGIKIRTDSLTINPFLILQIAKSTSKCLRIDWKVAKRIQMNLYRCKM